MGYIGVFFVLFEIVVFLGDFDVLVGYHRYFIGVFDDDDFCFVGLFRCYVSLIEEVNNDERTVLCRQFQRSIVPDVDSSMIPHVVSECNF